MKAGARVIEDVSTTPAGDEIMMLRDPWNLADSVCEAERADDVKGDRFKFQQRTLRLEDRRRRDCLKGIELLQHAAKGFQARDFGAGFFRLTQRFEKQLSNSSALPCSKSTSVEAL